MAKEAKFGPKQAELDDGERPAAPRVGMILHPIGMHSMEEVEVDPVHDLADGPPPADVDVLLWCGRWVVGRLVQYGRYVAPNVGVLNPTHWAECPVPPVGPVPPRAA